MKRRKMKTNPNHYFVSFRFEQPNLIICYCAKWDLFSFEKEKKTHAKHTVRLSFMANNWK